MGSLNNHCKKCCKIWHGHMVTCLMTGTSYDHNSGLNYGHNLRTTRITSILCALLAIKSCEVGEQDLEIGKIGG